MITPRASFGLREGRLLQALFWGMAALFLVIMAVAWRASEAAKPVLLDLETGRPIATGHQR